VPPGAAFSPKVFAERGERDVEPDVTAIPEAIRDGFGRRRHTHGDALDPPQLDAVLAGCAVSAHDLDRRRIDLGSPRTRVDEDPDRVRDLGREAVELQRAEEADGRVRDALRDLRERVELGRRSIRAAIKPATDALELAARAEPRQRGSRDPGDVEIATPKRASARETKNLRGVRHDSVSR
jgi:hypothetical protein